MLKIERGFRGVGAAFAGYLIAGLIGYPYEITWGLVAMFYGIAAFIALCRLLCRSAHSEPSSQADENWMPVRYSHPGDAYDYGVGTGFYRTRNVFEKPND